jgi:glyoxylase-like metal-dependent hydrolase (beta-lactamase superfamily II)
METIQHENFRLIKLGPLGPFANNAYIIADEESKEALLVDMPSGSEQALHAISEHGYNVKAILLTHSHGDHWADYGLVKNALPVPMMAHPDERGVLGDRIDEPLAHGQELEVGPYIITALHTPGHTPGSTCFVTGKHLLSGDTLFPGGPGRSGSPEDLRQMIDSITTHLFELPDETDVLPGHGDNGRIGDSKREYAVFAGKEQPVGLCGDVTWEGS